MSYGPYAVFTQTIASAATLSSEFDVGRSWKRVYLETTSMTSNSQIHIQAAATSGGTYRRVKIHDPGSATVSVDFAVASAATSHMMPVPTGFRYYKVETTATMDSGQSFNLVCSD